MYMFQVVYLNWWPLVCDCTVYDLHVPGRPLELVAAGSRLYRV